MTEPGGTYFESIDADECAALLRAARVGRVVWGGPDQVNVLPVNYHWEDGLIVFHTREASMLSQLATPTPVAFEVDEIDPELAVGWSVVARGTTAAHPGVPSASWIDGRELGIAIHVSALSGRVISGPQEQP